MSVESHFAHKLKRQNLGEMVTQLGGPILYPSGVFDNAYEIEELSVDYLILSVNGKYMKIYKPMLQEIQISME